MNFSTAIKKSNTDEWYTTRKDVERIVPFLIRGGYNKILCPFDTSESEYVKVLTERGFDVTYSHIADGVDFFDIDNLTDYDAVVSNPPFSKREAILKRLYENKVPFALILNFNGLFDSKTRWEMFRKYGVEILVPQGRMHFFNENCKGNSPNFQSVYVCKGMTDKTIEYLGDNDVSNDLNNLFVFDCECYAYDNVWVFKNAETNDYTVIHNNNEELMAFMQNDPLLVGYNNKNYDQYILKACLIDMTPPEVKEINDIIIESNVPGWQIPSMQNCGIYFDQFDLMDDTQKGTGLKDIEGHLGMDIQETTVPFDIDRPLTDAELEEVIHYCKHDVDATHILLKLREVYVANKLKLGQEKGIPAAKALYMTNAKLTAAYLDAEQKPHEDEREYVFPDNILWEFIPGEVKAFFETMHDKSISDEKLWERFIEIDVGGCLTKLGWGGIHGAIPNYTEETTEERFIENQDVGSYYPHLMTIEGYTSRNIPSAENYEKMLDRRMKAKKAGDKSLANALKLVANTTYGAMLSQFNDLYDPLQGRSVCVTGQLRLLELAIHLIDACPTLKLIQLNTDGIMYSYEPSDEETKESIVKEWQERTGYTLEADKVKKISQKDVNNYVELPMEGEPKVKGIALVRGVLTNGNIDFEALGFPQWINLMGGAFKINNNAVIVSKAVIDCIAYGTPVEETINASGNIFDFQIIAKTWSKCGNAYHMVWGAYEEVQRCNRVYAVDQYEYGTLYMIDPDTNNYRKLPGLPANVMVDNDNHLTIENIDKSWYIRLANRYVNDFYGIKPKRKAATTRKLNKIKKELLTMFD